MEIQKVSFDWEREIKIKHELYLSLYKNFISDSNYISFLFLLTWGRLVFLSFVYSLGASGIPHFCWPAECL